MKLKYVGVKLDGETAFSLQTGITWFPGDSHEVSDEHVKKMLNHPDVFAIDGAAPKAEAKSEPAVSMTLAPGAKVEVDKPVSITLKDGTVKVLDDLDKAALHALAKEVGVTVHHQSGAAKVVAALLEAFPAE